MSTNHWTHFLPEVGRLIIVKGNDQSYLISKISEAVNALEALKEKYRNNEKSIERTVEADWTSDEIANAKLRSVNCGYKDSSAYK